MNYPPPPPPIEWHVETQCGRNFAWSAVDLENLLARVIEKGYRPTFIMELSEYERMIADKQRELVQQHIQHIEEVA